jgi:hypothetical protein
LFLILRGAGLRPSWGRDLFEIPAHLAALCLAGASVAHAHDDNPAAWVCSPAGVPSVSFLWSELATRCLTGLGVRFACGRWSS